MKVIVVSPHRDDAAFSVGLAIADWLHAGCVVEVVNCFTRSEYSPFHDVGTVEDRHVTVTERRRCEDVSWAALYQPPVRLVDLDLWDAPQRLGCSVDEVCGFPVRRHDPAIDAIHSSLRARHADALLVPLAIGDHVDHVTARLGSEGGWPVGLPMAFYEDLPYAARPGGAATIEPRVESLRLALKPAFVREATDMAAAAERKSVLSRCYGSQIDAEVVDSIAGFAARYGGRERLWVNAAWQECFGTDDKGNA